MKLSRLLQNIDYETPFTLDEGITVTDIVRDSRCVKSGFLFVATKGEAADGHRYIYDALESGAVAIIGDEKEAFLSYSSHVPYILVKNSRQIYAELIEARYAHPSRTIKVIGITGTNGKTTITYLLHFILNRVASCGFLSTVEYNTGGRTIDAHQTTPDAYEINQYLAEMVAQNLAYCVMEVSSHALVQYRVYGMCFDGAIFTNLTPDHLDYHGTMEKYYLSKMTLFKDYSPEKLSVINSDDEYGQRLCSELKGTVVTYGVNTNADFKAEDITINSTGLAFNLRLGEKVFPLKSSLICLHNVYNILAAFAYVYSRGIRPEVIIEAIAQFPGVRGRMEPVFGGQPFSVFVDYAHTPDAFCNVFSSVEKFHKGAIITIFGCGGDRDRTKRGLMGKIASMSARHAILTNDNPRSEDEGRILSDIEKGLIKREGFTYEIIPDRRIAIEKGLALAKPGDMVLILGKGHEEYMIKNGKRFSFSDRLIAQEILNKEYTNA